MKFFVIISMVLLSNFTGVYAQSKSTLNLIKDLKVTIAENSIVSEFIDWNSLNNELSSVKYSRNHSLDKELVYDLFLKYLRKAGDQHSQFLTRNIKTYVENLQGDNPYPTSKYLGNLVGYLKIPSCMSFNITHDKSFTDSLFNQVIELKKMNVDKWIVDIRGNKGGNVWPMLYGLSPILGGGVINYTIKAKEQKPNYLTVNNKKTEANFVKLAVIVDNQTASSGELLAISLLGFPNTKSFGGPTRGLTTMNKTYSFKDGSTLYLAVGYMADRNKKIYKSAIYPDIQIDSQAEESTIFKNIINWFSE